MHIAQSETPMFVCFADDGRDAAAYSDCRFTAGAHTVELAVSMFLFVAMAFAWAMLPTTASAGEAAS